MAKGLVLEMQGQKAIVLVEGSFQRVPAIPGWQVGEEVEVATLVTHGVNWRRWVGVAAAAVVIGCGSVLGYGQYSLAQPVAVISVDINPSIQVTVNKKDTALFCLGVNAEGQAVLASVPCKGRLVSDIVRDVTAAAVDQGYLKPEGVDVAVLVAVAPAAGEDLATDVAQHLESDSRTSVQQVLADKGVPGQAVAVAADAQEREAAQKAGVSVGRYVLLEELKAKVPDAAQKLGVTPEKLAELGPAKVIQELNQKLNLSITMGGILHDRVGEDEGSGKDKGKGSSGKGQGSNGKGQGSNGNGQGSNGKGQGSNGNGQGSNGNGQGQSGNQTGNQGGQGDDKHGDKNDDKRGEVGRPAIDVIVPLPPLPGLLPGFGNQPGQGDKSRDDKGKPDLRGRDNWFGNGNAGTPSRDGQGSGRQDDRGQDGKGQDGKGQNGKGQDGKGQDGKGRDGKGQDGKG